ncbi:MAG: hypothetical protein RLZZ352_2128 [Pseudomonadota bacterium]
MLRKEDVCGGSAGRWWSDQGTHARTAALLQRVMTICLLLTLVLLGGSFVGGNVPPLATTLGLVWLALLGACWGLLRCSWVQWAALSLTVLFFVFITLIVASLGTVRAPFTGVYVFWVILSGMLFQRPGIWLATVASSVAVLCLIVAQNAGWLPAPNYSVGITQWINYTGLFVLTASLVYYSNRQLEQALQQAQAEIDRRRQTEAELARIATTDALTGIWNRRHALQMASTFKSHMGRYGHPLSLLLLDIDHFKSINDGYGHPAGDAVLVALTQRIQSAVRDADVFARWGGEEFVLLSPSCNLNQALQMAEKLRTLVEATPFEMAGQPKRVTISLGVAELERDESLERLFQRVDAALYAAKAGGRNTVSTAPPR